MKKINEFFVLDIETSGLNKWKDEILEVGIVKVKNSRISCFFSAVIKPTTRISKDSWIFQNSDLTWQEVMNAKTFNFYEAEIQKVFYELPVFAYNKRFDFGFLEKKGIQIPNEPEEPMFFARDIIKIKHAFYDYKYPSVQECLDFFKIPCVEPHRATPDAYLEALVILELMKYDK